MNSQKYWEKRRQLDNIKVLKEGEKGVKNLKKLLKKNLDDVEQKIKEYFEKYGDMKENLSPKEVLQYKKALKEAIKKVPKDKTLKKMLVNDAPKYKIDRLRSLQADLQIMLAEATRGQEKGIYNSLDDVAKISQAVLAKSLQKSIGLRFDTIAQRKLRQILISDWSGNNWNERLWKDRELVGKKVSDILQRGMVQGESLQTMARELKNATNQSFNNAFRLIRTETASVDSQVTLEGYKQAQKELGIKYFKYDAHLDSRTSQICQEMNGKIFKIDDYEIGVNAPPMHPNCRSTTQLILDEEEEKKVLVEKATADIEHNKNSIQIRTKDGVKNVNKSEISLSDEYMKKNRKQIELWDAKVQAMVRNPYANQQKTLKKQQKKEKIEELTKNYKRNSDLTPQEEFIQRQKTLKPYKYGEVAKEITEKLPTSDFIDMVLNKNLNSPQNEIVVGKIKQNVSDFLSKQGIELSKKDISLTKRKVGHSLRDSKNLLQKLTPEQLKSIDEIIDKNNAYFDTQKKNILYIKKLETKDTHNTIKIPVNLRKTNEVATVSKVPLISIMNDNRYKKKD